MMKNILKYLLFYLLTCFSVFILFDEISLSLITVDTVIPVVVYALFIDVVVMVYFLLNKQLYKIKRRRAYVILRSTVITVIVCIILMLLQKVFVPILGIKSLDTSTLLAFPILLFFGILLNDSFARRRIKKN